MTDEQGHLAKDEPQNYCHVKEPHCSNPCATTVCPPKLSPFFQLSTHLHDATDHKPITSGTSKPQELHSKKPKKMPPDEPNPIPRHSPFPLRVSHHASLVPRPHQSTKPYPPSPTLNSTTHCALVKPPCLPVQPYYPTCEYDRLTPTISLHLRPPLMDPLLPPDLPERHKMVAGLPPKVTPDRMIFKPSQPPRLPSPASPTPGQPAKSAPTPTKAAPAPTQTNWMALTNSSTPAARRTVRTAVDDDDTIRTPVNSPISIRVFNLNSHASATAVNQVLDAIAQINVRNGQTLAPTHIEYIHSSVTTLLNVGPDTKNLITQYETHPNAVVITFKKDAFTRKMATIANLNKIITALRGKGLEAFVSSADKVDRRNYGYFIFQPKDPELTPDATAPKINNVAARAFVRRQCLSVGHPSTATFGNLAKSQQAGQRMVATVKFTHPVSVSLMDEIMCNLTEPWEWLSYSITYTRPDDYIAVNSPAMIACTDFGTCNDNHMEVLLAELQTLTDAFNNGKTLVDDIPLHYVLDDGAFWHGRFFAVSCSSLDLANYIIANADNRVMNDYEKRYWEFVYDLNEHRCRTKRARDYFADRDRDATQTANNEATKAAYHELHVLGKKVDMEAARGRDTQANRAENRAFKTAVVLVMCSNQESNLNTTKTSRAERQLSDNNHNIDNLEDKIDDAEDRLIDLENDKSPAAAIKADKLRAKIAKWEAKVTVAEEERTKAAALIQVCESYVSPSYQRLLHHFEGDEMLQTIKSTTPMRLHDGTTSAHITIGPPDEPLDITMSTTPAYLGLAP